MKHLCMRPSYQYSYADPLHHFQLAHPDEAVIDAWLADMNTLVRHYSRLPGPLVVRILIEYDQSYATVPLRYTINRAIDWMQTTPRAHPARTCVLTSETVLPAIITPLLNVFSGRDKIRVLHMSERKAALAWLLDEQAKPPHEASSRPFQPQTGQSSK